MSKEATLHEMDGEWRDLLIEFGTKHGIERLTLNMVHSFLHVFDYCNSNGTAESLVDDVNASFSFNKIPYLLSKLDEFQRH